MKKKLFIWIGIAVIALAIITGVIFLILTKDVKPNDTDFTLEGTWKAYDCNVENTVDQYYVFTETEVKVYRGTSETPVVTSKYEIKNEGTLELNVIDLDRLYHLKRYGDNYVSLYYYAAESSVTLVKTNDKELTSFDNISGKWNAIRKDKNPSTEVLEFDNGNFKLYASNTATAPQIECTYTLENGVVILDTYNVHYDIAYLSDNLAILVNLANGSIYEIKK